MKKTSYIKFLKVRWIGLLLVLGFIVVSIDVIGLKRDYDQRVKTMRKNYIASKKEEIKREVVRFCDTAEADRKKYIEKSKQALNADVDNAYRVVANIYTKNRASKSESEIKKIILEVLSPVQFADGRGRYTLFDLQGNALLFPCMPKMVGKNILGLKNDEGHYIVKEIIDAVRKSGRGTTTLCFKKQGEDKERKMMISFRLFKPYGWVVCSGLYMDDVLAQIKADFLQSVSCARYGKNGYFFSGDDKGVILAHGAMPEVVGKNLWDLADSNGKKFVQAFVNVYKSGKGGYVDYVWPKPHTTNNYPKITYVAGTLGGNCYLGTGVYLDDVEAMVAKQRQALVGDILERLLLFTAYIALVIVVFIIFSNWFGSRLGAEFNRFLTFFSNSVDSNEAIDRDSIHFTEFDQMAVAANKMLRERILSQSEIEQKREQLAVTLRSIADGVITTDTDGHITMMNPVAEHLTGWCTPDAVGKPLRDIFHIVDSETGKPVKSPIDKVLQEQHAVTADVACTLTSKAGQSYTISESAAPILDHSGKILGVVLVFRDMTDQRRAEAVLLNAKRRASIGVLAGGIAHDFNNILMGLFGNIELAKFELPEDHTASAFLNTAEESLKRATDLTQQLLTFAKGGAPLLSAVRLDDVVNNAVNFNLSGSNIKAEFDMPDDLWDVSADRGQINQVISNLVINAKQAMPDGGILRISARNLPADSADNSLENSVDCVELVLSDTGYGIPRENIDKIFDPYFSTKAHGSGIGLATAYSIVTKHHGVITVNSTPQKGTAFRILLPAGSPDDIEQDASIESDAAISRDFNAHPLSAKILIMDDEPVIIETVGRMVQSCGCTYQSACDGAEALEKYIEAYNRNEAFDIVIMDLTIPGGMGGKEAVKRFLEFDPQAKIIVSSGYSVDAVLSDYQRYGFVGRLAKPFNINAVTALLLNLVDKKMKH